MRGAAVQRTLSLVTQIFSYFAPDIYNSWSFSQSLLGGGGGDGATLPCAQLLTLCARVRSHEGDCRGPPPRCHRYSVLKLSLLTGSILLLYCM